MADPTEPVPASDPDPMEPQVPPMPRWIPTLIAMILVVLGALAVYTGIQNRRGRIDKPLPQARAVIEPVERGGAPGEPQAGASRVLHGEHGENVPLPATADPSPASRVVITGGGDKGVSTTIRYSARRGMALQIDPSDASVYVNDQTIGSANQFRGPDDVYEFADAGTFTVRLAAPNFKDEIFVVTADPAASQEVITIKRKMVR